MKHDPNPAHRDWPIRMLQTFLLVPEGAEGGGGECGGKTDALTVREELIETGESPIGDIFPVTREHQITRQRLYF
jgi:hypothetical protein